MRLNDSQRQIIKSAVAGIVGAETRIWLFGSRTDDTLRGGDIDLLVETGRIIADRVGVLCKLEGALVMGLGDRKIDVVLKDARTGDAPLFGLAREKGILL